MGEQDQAIETRRARDLARYHRRVAEWRAAGLCLKCGQRPPAPHRSQCAGCLEKRRAADLVRYHQRTARRVAQGLCPKCGKHPPAPGRGVCASCAEKDRAAGRARDARLRAAGMPRRDPARARAYDRERARRETVERRAAGVCVSCGRAPAEAGRVTCGDCAETRRGRDRAKYAEAKAAGRLYGGRKVATRRRIGRARGAKRLAARIAAGRCTGCGKQPPSRAVRPVRPVVKRAGWPSGHCTASVAPRACAAVAAVSPPTAARGVVRARCASPSVATPRRGTPPPGNSMRVGRRGACVPPAAPRPRGRRGANPVRGGPASARRPSARCRSTPRSTPSSTSTPATPTAPTMPGRTWRLRWPSPASHPSGSRC